MDARVALENDEILGLLCFTVYLRPRMFRVRPRLRIVLRFHLVKIVYIRFAVCTQRNSLHPEKNLAFAGSPHSFLRMGIRASVSAL